MTLDLRALSHGAYDVGLGSAVARYIAQNGQGLHLTQRLARH